MIESSCNVDNARALLRNIYMMEADIIPNEKEQILRIRLHHLSNPSSDKVARLLAGHLNETETIYPVTNLRLHYDLVSD
ncbi:MAG: hypothetical protein GY797_27180 [Deltaproteobacteria bacterium]|nr:hypothetical protein [Deltaproteobacteria bacterium]